MEKSVSVGFVQVQLIEVGRYVLFTRAMILLGGVVSGKGLDAGICR